MKVRARAPLRLGLAGGGTDVSPYCDIHGGLVLNATIDKYAYATLSTSEDGQAHFAAADRQELEICEPHGRIALDRGLSLHKGVHNRIVNEFNDGRPLPICLTTFSDAAPGSGLGSSSTLVVAMVKAYAEMLRLPLGDYDIARLAWCVERRDVGLSGGRQDQYAATFGGFNFMEFQPGERVVINPLRIKSWVVSELEASLLLYFGGVSRESAAIIDDQSARVRNGDEAALQATHELKLEASTMKEGLLKGDLESLMASMRRGWLAKKRISDGVSNEAIERAYAIAEGAGMRAGKVSGAGGGGFIMMLVDPVRRMDVIRALANSPGEVLTCRFTKYGAEGWRVA